MRCTEGGNSLYGRLVFSTRTLQGSYQHGCMPFLEGRLPKIFVNYRREDTAGVAGRIADRLRQEFGDDSVFIDVENVRLGNDFVELMINEVDRCDTMIVAIGPAWIDSRDKAGGRRLDDPHDYVRTEIRAALQRNKHVIPILVDDAEMPRKDVLPNDIARLSVRAGLDVRHVSFRLDLDRLVSELKRPAVKGDSVPAAQAYPAELPIHPPFRRFAARLGPATGLPEAATARTDDIDRSAAQFVHEHAIVLWIKGRKVFYRLRRGKSGKWDKYAHSQEVQDCEWFQDDWLREKFRPPADKLPPTAGVAYEWSMNPSKWKWIGWREPRRSYGLFGDKVFVQSFEKGHITGPWATGFKKEALVFVLFSDGSWEAHSTAEDAPLIAEITYPPPRQKG
jgi:hypothetical protein